MKKLTILVDLDDTAEDLLGAWCLWLNNHYGTEFYPDDITTWDLSDKFAPLTKQQVFQPLQTAGFWKTVQPKPEAQLYLKKLADDGHDVYFVSATHYTSAFVKQVHMVERLFPFVDWDHIIFTENKQMILGDVIVDDGLHNLLGSDKHKLMMDAPHNRGIDAAMFGIKRVHSWQEIYDAISAIAEAE